jgi:hypothetical protein
LSGPRLDADTQGSGRGAKVPKRLEGWR